MELIIKKKMEGRKEGRSHLNIYLGNYRRKYDRSIPWSTMQILKVMFLKTM